MARDARQPARPAIADRLARDGAEEAEHQPATTSSAVHSPCTTPGRSSGVTKCSARPSSTKPKSRSIQASQAPLRGSRRSRPAAVASATYGSAHAEPEREEEREAERRRLPRADVEQERGDDRPDAGRADDAHREPHEERAERALAAAARRLHEHRRQPHLVEPEVAERERHHQERDPAKDDRLLHRGAEERSGERRGDAERGEGEADAEDVEQRVRRPGCSRAAVRPPKNATVTEIIGIDAGREVEREPEEPHPEERDAPSPARDGSRRPRCPTPAPAAPVLLLGDQLEGPRRQAGRVVARLVAEPRAKRAPPAAAPPVSGAVSRTVPS